MKNPPFDINPGILTLCINIQDLLGQLKTAEIVKPPVKLRKENRIKTIHHSLAIEGNTLTEEQITAILENKKVVGPKKQIQEVVNALKLYDSIHKFKFGSEKDLLKAHKILMQGLVDSAGSYRARNVGIIKGNKVGHVAPQAKMVPGLMKDLFHFLNANNQISLLIKACVFHYELEFIHPFEDGNGRMGRLWQQLILIQHSSIFEFIPVESIIHKEQKKYYKVLEQCDRVGNSNAFIEFSLGMILKALREFSEEYRPSKIVGSDRISKALEAFGDKHFSRKQYMSIHKSISTATASRDLADAVKKGELSKEGEKALTLYKKAK